MAEEIKGVGAPEAIPEETIAQLNHLVEHLQDSESHYLREENVLFPHLKKYGITQPPTIMWMEHDKGDKEENLPDCG